MSLRPIPLAEPPPPPRGKRPSAATLRHQAIEEQKRSFLRMVSHELRTPLNAIIGFSEIISRELYGPMQEPRYRDHAEIVRDSGLKLLRLVNQVMEIAKLEGGGADLDLRAEPLEPALKEAIAGLTVEAEAKGLRIGILAEEGLPLARADTRALKQVFTNLLQNAVQHSPEGGEITVSLSRRGESILAEVKDQGPGLAPAEFARVMRPFEQGENALTRRSEGAGLGLPIANMLCDSMGGRLRLRSQPGEGLTAVVRLPVARDASGVRAA
jgi:signal transduction histidine kinase